jgi:glycosyltransferase involved in cell wall biosynthesis
VNLSHSYGGCEEGSPDTRAGTSQRASPRAKPRLAILVSHPIQYLPPWFRALASRVDLQVYYALRQNRNQQAKAGFGVPFEWDIDLFSGYAHRFLRNRSLNPSTRHFFGCDTPEICEAIRAGRFDACIVCGWQLKTYWQAVWACRRNAVPTFVRGDSQLLTPRSKLKFVVKALLYPRLLGLFDGFLFVGRLNKEYLRHYGVPDAKLHFVPHFVDNEWFGREARRLATIRPRVRQSWGADPETLVVLFVGKFQHFKRPLDTVHALSVVQAMGVNAIGVFVGSGEMGERLATEASTLGVTARFEGFRNQSELPRYYVAADVLVLPSESETWGLVVNEAMACGLPAIVSNVVGCAPDLIEEGTTGFTFKVTNVGDLAHKLALLESRRRSGYDFTGAVAHRIQRYSAATALTGTLRALESLAPRASAPLAQS